ncbi:Crp/Fnr family transcriptional regulator [Thiomicrorhabdus xiamenensis]|uniref:Cyclic nucleotide-binding domain-containing protein n=1 Tax=Thiomicrorhabdus xiamenensis TaxID=2739063 RepID=A0A7D4SN28_9GAMM|nr:cyclic nucleotide-binding domain-containing protein [Thiomicrorhabdus xiamenensis]QKI89101.1 cyclic nucleotide-binding domain-containing protein [Thiomicrorhabdus xiamenensis]
MLSMTAKELFRFFQNHLICESLTLEEVEKLMAYLQERDFTKDEVIFDIGEVGDALGFVMNGRVQFIGPDKDNVAVGTQGEGSLIGEMSFFDRKPRDLRMKACGKEGVTILMLTRPMYDRLKVEEPFIAVNILENTIVSLDNLVRHMGEDISALGHYMHGFGRQ